MKYLFLISSVFLFCCENHEEELATKTEVIEDKPIEKHERPVSVKNRKFFEVNERQMLYGGKDSSQHFDITNYMLKNEQFHYGIGREEFPALLNPAFISIEDADSIWADTSRFLIAYSGKETKAYSVKDLTRHEVVNDVLDDKPIMAAYCILADLGAIYERSYGDRTLTFALSGYTYYDDNVWNGLDGFVLWDRETESLWWPLIDKAVSGPLKGVHLQEMNRANWKDCTWQEVKNSYPTALVMRSGQDYERPTTWEKIKDVSEIVTNFSHKE